jgi:hypothetical protein
MCSDFEAVTRSALAARRTRPSSSMTAIDAEASGRATDTGMGVSTNRLASIACALAALDRQRSPGHLAEHAAKRIDVTAAVDVALPDDLLGAHVRRV